MSVRFQFFFKQVYQLVKIKRKIENAREVFENSPQKSPKSLPFPIMSAKYRYFELYSLLNTFIYTVLIGCTNKDIGISEIF